MPEEEHKQYHRVKKTTKRNGDVKVKIEKVHLTCTLQQSGFLLCHLRSRLF